ncbi:Tricarboxylate transport protein [Colletotrichum siamense]|nr:Tricarboxylate transport protein [Colletotrichum siamense]
MSRSSTSPTPLQSVVAGAAAGGVESLVTYPTEYIKTRKQLLSSSESPLRILVSAVRTSGPGVLYTGASAFCVSNASKSGVRFFTFDAIRKKLPQDAQTGKPTKVANMLAGVAAGVAESVTVVTPGENIKTKIVEDRAGARRFKSTSHAIRSIVAMEGLGGLFRGILPVTLKQGSNALVRFTSYNALLDVISPPMELRGKGSLAPVFAGATAGVITVYATMPFDVVKTKMQALEGTNVHRGTWRCASAIVQDSGLSGLWKGTTPRLARLSISGALSFTIYENVCDGEVPACTNCAKAGETCLDVDSQNSGLLVPRNFASAARARIQWLEDIIKSRLPDVDLSTGPQIDAFPDPKGSAAVGGGGDLEDDNVSTPSPRSGRAGSQPTGRTASLGSQRQSLKRPAEAAGSYDHDEQFPDRAHSVAMNLGMLSLNSDSSQKHYLGSSSGVLFTNLIGASPSSAGSTPAALLEDVQAQGPSSEWYDTSVPTDISKQYNRSLHIFLRQELPRKEDAIKLVHTYVRWMHPDYPVLEPTSLLSALDALYSTFSCSLDDDPFPHGWPSTMQAFRWNGRQRLPGDQGVHSVPMPVVAFILFMVFNIAAIVKVRGRVYEFPPERFYRAALHFSKDCFSQISLSSIQALVVLIVHSMLTPAEVNLWTLIHIALAHCVELGIHREPLNTIEPADFENQQIRRLTFFTIYSLDRSVSSIQGRPLGFRDETFDIKLPESPPAHPGSASGTIPLSFSAAVLRFAIYQFELDRMVSDVKLQLYHLPCDSAWFPLPQNPPAQQARIKEELVDWWDRVSSETFDFPGIDNRQRRMWQIKLKVKYHTTMVMLFQPSQAIRNPSPESLQVCFNNAASILHDYQALHDMQGLHHGWRTVQNIFAAGATLIYSFWTCSTVRQNASTADLSKSLRTCSSLLTVGGEWWPSVKKGQRSFGAIVDLTIRKLYTGNMPSKNPRLYMPLGADRLEDGQNALDHADGGHSVYDATAQQADLAHIPLNGADAAWHQMPGSSAVAMAHSQDAVHWQGVYPEPPFHGGSNDYVPEIETFLADFDKSEFSWSFPLAGIGDPYEMGNFPNPSY